MENQIQKQSGLHYAWIVLVAMCGIQMGTMGTVSSCMGVFTPSVVEDLNVPVTAVSLYFTVRTLAMAIFQPVAGRIFAKFDVRLVITSAVILGNGGMMILYFFHHIWGWYISAVISGIGLSFICYLLVPIILSNWYKKSLGLAIGIAAAFTGVGGAIFSPLCGQWITQYGFRLTYIIVGGIGMILSLICAIFLLRTKPEDKGLLPYGADKDGADGSAAIDTRGMTVKEMVKTPGFFLVYFIVICIYFAASFMQDLTNYAVSKGFDIAHAATVSSAMMIGIIVGKILLGSINDRFGAKVTVTCGSAVGLVAFFCLLNGGKAASFVFVGAFLFGCCVGSMSVSPALVIKRSFGNKEYAKIYSYAATAGVLTSAVGHPIYAGVFDITGSYDAIMVVAAIALILSIVIAWTIIDKCNKRWDA